MWWILLACTREEPPPPCDPAAAPVCSCSAPSITLGDGAEIFNPLEQNQEATIVHGPQGGWHVLASVQVQNTDAFLALHYTIDLMPDLARVSDNLYYVQMSNWVDCNGGIYDIFGYLDVTKLAVGDLNTPPELLVGRTLRLTMDATDTTGRNAVTTVDIVGIPDAKDVNHDSGGTDTGADTGDTAPP